MLLSFGLLNWRGIGIASHGVVTPDRDSVIPLIPCHSTAHTTDFNDDMQISVPTPFVGIQRGRHRLLTSMISVLHST